MDEAKLKRWDVANRTLEELIKATADSYGLETKDISASIIKSRLARSNPAGTSQSSTSPMLEAEPYIAEYCIRLARIGEPLTKKGVLELARSFIAGETETETKFIAWLKKHSTYNPDSPLLTSGWYNGFWKKNKAVLERKVARQRDNKCQTWARSET
jgi:hypothetical protein